jgi:uncharacterized protein YndB with AHSA1/START domain
MTPERSAERDGELVKVGERDAVRFERRLSHPAERVWRAITDRDELAAWFPADIEGELTSVGAELSFPFREGEAETETGEVLESDPPRLLAFTWGGQTLRFDLTPDGDGTRLVFTHALDRAETAKTAAGWQVCFDELEAALDGRPKPEFPEDRWTELHEGYAAEFGVDPEEGRRALAEVQAAREAHREDGAS